MVRVSKLKTNGGEREWKKHYKDNRALVDIFNTLAKYFNFDWNNLLKKVFILNCQIKLRKQSTKTEYNFVTAILFLNLCWI